MAENQNPYDSPRAPLERPEVSDVRVDGLVRVCQIIVVALVMGLLAFCLFGLYAMIQQGAALNWNLSVLAIVGLGMAGTNIPASFVIPPLIAAKQNVTVSGSFKEKSETLLGTFQTQLIVGLALIEGAGFLNAIAFQQGHNPISFLAALGCAGFMLTRFPTKKKVEYWLAQRMQ